jgi:hypothetical protein
VTSHSVRSVSLGWREPFVWRRVAVGLALAMLPFAVCLALKAGFLAWLALALGCYPWPVRVAVDQRGVSLRWLFVRETLSAEDLVRARLTEDTRRWAWPRRKVLVLERRGTRPLLFFGPGATLASLLELTTQSIERSRQS